MNEQPSPSILPEFPEGDEPQRRRSPRWKRGLRSLGDAWVNWTGPVADGAAALFGPLWNNVKGYVRGRQLRRLMYGLPALAVLTGVAVMAALLVQAGRSDARPAYRARAQQARTGHELELARVCYLRLLRDDNPQPADMFGLYQTLRDLKQDEMADALLRQLTVWKGKGYAPAHVVRARNLLAATPLTGQDLRDAESHLQLAIDAQPDLTEAHALLGELYFRLQRYEDAEKHLVDGVKADPMLARLLMHATIAQGKADDGNRWAESTIEVCRKRLAADPNNTDPNTTVTRLILVEGCMNLKKRDYKAVQEELEKGMRLDPDHTADYRLAMSQVCATEVQALPADNTARRWDLVDMGLRNNPNNLALLRQLMQITHGTDPTAEPARQRLLELLARGQASAVLHMALGLDAYAEGKPDQARVHWERAVDLDRDRMLVAANNVAWLLSHPQPDEHKALLLAGGVQTLLVPATVEPANLSRALELIQFVLKKDPENARFRETRGQIYLRMGEWDRSVSDLDYALPKLANKGPIHVSLAEAYQKLGLPELAEEHRKLARTAKP